MKKFEITEKQIKDIYEDGCTYIKEWFPEVFETKLEVGRWYKYPKQGYADIMFCFQGVYSINNTSKAYGFTRDKNWHEILGVDEFEIKEYIEATDSEVLEALKNEAIKRGFEENNYRCLVLPSLTHNVKMNYFYNSSENTLRVGEITGFQNVIFDNGKWAEIIKTYTKEEAEKLLNSKIL